ncbi:hypothetical protein STSP_65690 [Streptomyces jeddahensis]|uniref:Uncharacterized protein n=1 Tax=Streptomyces jeddahensis TaxID=1716141 RepID=A0A177HGG0_9ACTN|nr:hypothetical protein STSP_65690 [Streptomyces jeddahensis]
MCVGRAGWRRASRGHGVRAVAAGACAVGTAGCTGAWARSGAADRARRGPRAARRRDPCRGARRTAPEAPGGRSVGAELTAAPRQPDGGPGGGCRRRTAAARRRPDRPGGRPHDDGRLADGGCTGRPRRLCGRTGRLCGRTGRSGEDMEDTWSGPGGEKGRWRKNLGSIDDSSRGNAPEERTGERDQRRRRRCHPRFLRIIRNRLTTCVVAGSNRVNALEWRYAAVEGDDIRPGEICSGVRNGGRHPSYIRMPGRGAFL